MTVLVSKSTSVISRKSRFFILASGPFSTDDDVFVMPDFNIFEGRFVSKTDGILIEMLSSNYTVTLSSICVYRGCYMDVAILLSVNGVFRP